MQGAGNNSQPECHYVIGFADQLKFSLTKPLSRAAAAVDVEFYPGNMACRV
jgi:hypothetical protein